MRLITTSLLNNKGIEVIGVKSLPRVFLPVCGTVRRLNSLPTSRCSKTLRLMSDVNRAAWLSMNSAAFNDSSAWIPETSVSQIERSIPLTFSERRLICVIGTSRPRLSRTLLLTMHRSLKRQSWVNSGDAVTSKPLSCRNAKRLTFPWGRAWLSFFLAFPLPAGEWRQLHLSNLCRTCTNSTQ